MSTRVRSGWVTVEGLVADPRTHFSKPADVYEARRHATHPLPYRKLGKRLLFDLDAVFKWYESLPGRDTVTLGDF